MSSFILKNSKNFEIVNRVVGEQDRDLLRTHKPPEKRNATRPILGPAASSPRERARGWSGGAVCETEYQGDGGNHLGRAIRGDLGSERNPWAKIPRRRQASAMR